jgi:hypothetical protein
MKMLPIQRIRFDRPMTGERGTVLRLHPLAQWRAFKTYTGFTVEDWPYVYTTPADRQSDAPYAFWLGKEGHA